LVTTQKSRGKSGKRQKPANPLEFLGRQAAEFGLNIHGLEERLNGESPEEIANIVRGYVQQQIDSGQYLDAYDTLQQGWLKHLLPDKKEIERQAVIGLARTAKDQQHEAKIRTDKRIEEIIKSDHPCLLDMARAVEETDLELATWIYNRKKSTADFIRLAQKYLPTDRERAFRLVKNPEYNTTRLQMVRQVLDAEGLGTADYAFALDALANVGWRDSGDWRLDEEAYNRIQYCLTKIIEATIDTAPELTLKATDRFKKDATEVAERKSVMKRIIESALKLGKPATALGAANSICPVKGEEDEAITRYRQIVENALANHDPKTALAAVVHREPTDPKEKYSLLERIMTAQMEKDAFEAFSWTSQTYRDKAIELFYRIARTNLIRKHGEGNSEAVIKALSPPNTTNTDNDGIRELAEHLYKRAGEETDPEKKWRLYASARLAFFGLPHHSHPDKLADCIDCGKQLLLNAPHIIQDSDFGITDEEFISAGVELVDTDPSRAWEYLKSHIAKPEVKGVIGKLSKPLEDAGKTTGAYFAEKASASPDEKILDRLRLRLVEEDRARSTYISLPHTLHNDVRGRQIFYDIRGPKMELSNRYSFALETSRMTDQPFWQEQLQSLRAEMAGKNIVEARRIFREDPEGLALIEAKLREKAPELAKYEGLTRRVLDLNPKSS
jgi:hypothetical protein